VVECYLLTTVSVCSVQCAGIQKLREREYMGTIQSCKVNADYIAVRFDGRVNLHMVCSTEVYCQIIIIVIINDYDRSQWSSGSIPDCSA